jgi:hypothetical protein
MIWRPLSSEFESSEMARSASPAEPNSTTPHPLDRPSPSPSTSARTTWPAGLKWSLSSCHVVSYDRLPTYTRRPMDSALPEPPPPPPPLILRGRGRGRGGEGEERRGGSVRV